MRIAVYTNILRVTVLARRCAAYMEEPEVCVCPVSGMDDWNAMRADADLHLFLWMILDQNATTEVSLRP